MNVPAYNSEPRKPKTKWVVASAIVVLVFVCGLAALFAFVIGPRMFPFMYGDYGLDDSLAAKSSGPSKSMAEMLELAQAEARKTDPDVVLDSLFASTPGYFSRITYTGPISGSLDVTVEFRRPTGNYMTVDFEDADPNGTLDVYLSTYESKDKDLTVMYENAKNREESYIGLLRKYKLTPRDAVAKTWDDIHEFTRKNGISEEQVQPLISVGPAKDGNPTWTVHYRYLETRDPTSQGELFGADGTMVDYTIDGLTGEIIKADYQTASPTPTTAP